MDFKAKIVMLLLFFCTGCQQEVTDNSDVVVEIVADKNAAMLINECFLDLDTPTKYPKFREVSKMVRNFSLGSNSFSKETAQLIDKAPNDYKNSNIYQQGLLEYTNLIWNKAEKSILKKQKEFQIMAKKHLNNEYFKRIYKFYGAKLPKNYHLKIYLMPVLGSDKFATPIGDNKIFITSMDHDVATHFGIIAHECCHVAYHKKNKDKMEKFFKNHKSGIGSIVFNVIDEGLATAIGNRVFKISIDGVDSEEAYAFPHINNFSKKLKYLAKEYLDKGKEMDEEFWGKAIKLFAIENPEAKNNLDILMHTTTVFTDKPDSSYKNLLNLAWASRFLMQSIDIKALDTIVKERETLDPYIYIISNNAKCADSVEGKDYLHVKKLSDGKITIVVKTDDMEKIRVAFKYLKDNPIVKKTFTVRL
ncbi:MAG: hypothetical protein LBI26_01890 [Holosporales bacterium]|jgi:hypothetical protein|nr:hypothetical protein [Holosporales bacterium]